MVCIELSKKENEMNVQRNKEQGMEELIIVPGELSFDDTKEEAGAFDCVVSVTIKCATLGPSSKAHTSAKAASEPLP